MELTGPGPQQSKGAIGRRGKRPRPLAIPVSLTEGSTRAGTVWLNRVWERTVRGRHHEVSRRIATLGPGSASTREVRLTQASDRRGQWLCRAVQPTGERPTRGVPFAHTPDNYTSSETEQLTPEGTLTSREESRYVRRV